MPSKAFSPRTAFVIGVAAVGSMSGWSPGPMPFGITEAVARTHTRKRVNGRWVTGRFPDRNVKQRYASLPARPAEPDDHPLPPARPERGDRASLADRVIATASLAPVPADERMETMRPALEARARSLAGDAFALPLPEPQPPLPAPLTGR